MELTEWLLVKSDLVALVKSLSKSLDSYYYLAYLVLILFRLNTSPVLFLIVGLSLTFELTLSLPEYQFFILCSIACSYVTIYYHKQYERACIGLSVMTVYLFIMAQESLLNAVFGKWLYTALHNSYEVFISSIHLLIVLLFIRWGKVFSFMVEFINDARSGKNGTYRIFIVL